MAAVLLKVRRRGGLGKGAARKLRAQRLIPGVVYGGAVGAIPVAVDPSELTKALGTGAGENVLITLSVSGDGERTATVILKELQRDPLRGTPLHVDFLEVSMKRKIRVEVPLRFVGEPAGVKKGGGFLEQHLREVTVECLPHAIPDEIRVDVSALDLGDALHVRDLVGSEGAKIVEDGARAVVSVLAPAAAKEEVLPEAKPTEPELVARKEGKETKEGKEEPAKAGG
jgi:large subunit ribosomal protein L25